MESQLQGGCRHALIFQKLLSLFVFGTSTIREIKNFSAKFSH